MLNRLTTLAKGLIAEKFGGRVWAYSAVCVDGTFGIGICVRNEQGFHPVPAWMSSAATLSDAQFYADVLNGERCFTEKQAAAVVASTMGFTSEETSPFRRLTPTPRRAASW